MLTWRSASFTTVIIHKRPYKMSIITDCHVCSHCGSTSCDPYPTHIFFEISFVNVIYRIEVRGKIFIYIIYFNLEIMESQILLDSNNNFHALIRDLFFVCINKNSIKKHVFFSKRKRKAMYT